MKKKKNLKILFMNYYKIETEEQKNKELKEMLSKSDI